MEPKQTEKQHQKLERESWLFKPLDPALPEANSPLCVPRYMDQYPTHSFLSFLILKLKLFREGCYYFQPKDSWLISHPVQLTLSDKNEKRTHGEDRLELILNRIWGLPLNSNYWCPGYLTVKAGCTADMFSFKGTYYLAKSNETGTDLNQKTGNPPSYFPDN